MAGPSGQHDGGVGGTYPEQGITHARSVDVRLLGPLVVSVGAQTVALSGARAQKLLALLALNGTSVVPFDRIVDVLWEDPPSSARQQVHNVVGSLRRKLETAGARLEVATSSVGYLISLPEAAVDVFRFRAHVREAEKAEAGGSLDEAIGSLKLALSEWRGPAFSGLQSRHLQDMATVLTDQRLAAAERLAELQIRMGDSAAVVGDLMELVAENPFREALRALLMKALHYSGRQVDALAVFEEGRRRLVEDLGLDPGPQLQAAQQLVLTGNGRARGPSTGDQSPQGRPGSSKRNFLPRDILEFTGRAGELQSLMSDARRTDKTALIISSIDGMGGVGKSTLAIHLAHKLAQDFPDGQYFVDLAGYSASAQPLSPLQALNLLLRSSGILPELIPRELERRSALWRSSLAGQRVLLLLDNAVDATQVRPLLPGGADALVLISSRRRMPSLEGALSLSLDVMPHADAMSLFEQIAGQQRIAAEQDAAAEAVRLCGHLPLAIRIAAARLRDRPGWSVTYLAEQLRDRESRARILATGDRNVMSILAWSYRQLTPCQQLLFRLLGILSGPDFDAYAAAALTGLSVDEAAACLEELFEVNLLQQHAAGRYRFHDLIRDCSRSLLVQHSDDAERTSATLRTLDYYLRSADLWSKPLWTEAYHLDPDVAYEPQAVRRPATTVAAAEFLEIEYWNFVAAMRLTVDIGSHGRTWQLACCMLPYFRRLNYGADAEALLEQARQAARADGSERGESACLMGLSHAISARGLNAEASEVARQAIELSRRIGDQEMEVFQLTGLGIFYWRDNRVDEALACFTRTLELAQGTGNLQAEINITNNLGVICRDLGRLDEALQYYLRTLALQEGANALPSRTLGNIGQVLCLQGNYSDAAARFEEALRVSRSAASPHWEALALASLCAVRRLMGDHAGSLECGREGLEIARTSAMYDAEVDALNALLDTYLALGDIETAEQLGEQARALAVRFKSARHTALSDDGLAHIHSARGDPEAARKYWGQALATYPGGGVDSIAARRHLVAPGYGAETCWRCIRASG